MHLVKEIDCPECDLHSSRRMGKAKLPSTWSNYSLLEPVVADQNKIDYRRSKSKTLKFTNADCCDLDVDLDWSLCCIILNLKDR
jgi:hypothetical protein